MSKPNLLIERPKICNILNYKIDEDKIFISFDNEKKFLIKFMI